MLTRDLALASYERGRVLPDRLTRGAQGHYVALAERMLQVYRTGAGRTRSELHRDVHNLFAFEMNCPTRRIDGFCKLLDDVSEFHHDARGRAAKLRREVFHAAARLHPLVREADRFFETTEAVAKTQIAQQLGQPWETIESELFADIIDFHRLKSCDGYPDGVSLLSRYNVAQVQVALFGAVSMTVWATEDFKTILRYAKLARLMHSIRRVEPVANSTHDAAYEFTFDGPASVLRETRRYGVAMAKFLPALLACRGWRMHAVIQTPKAGWQVGLDLTPADGLHSHLPAPDEFDSDLEADFARKWGDAPRDGWTLSRESDILHSGQKVFLPDFTLRHTDGRQVLLEIIGYWTAEYLQRKLQTLQHFRATPILLAVAESIADQLPPLPIGTILYKTTLKISDVVSRLSGPSP